MDCGAYLLAPHNEEEDEEGEERERE